MRERQKNRSAVVAGLFLAGVLMIGAVAADGASAPIIPGGPPVTVTIATAGDSATLSFDGTLGQRISLKLSSVTIASSVVSIVNPSGTTLASTSVSKSGGFIDTRTLAETGSYSIVVDPQLSYTGSMTLTLYDVPPDAAGTITPGGAAQTVSTAVPGQNARLAFAGDAGQRISLRLTSVTAATKISILKPDATTLVLPLTVGTSGGFIDVKALPVSGTYTIVVDPQSFATASATLTLYDVPPDTTAPITLGGASVTVRTTVPGQNAQATFAGTAGQRLALKISGVTIGTSTSSSAKVSILKPGGTTLVSPVSFGTGGTFIDTRTLPTTGTYTILVDPQSFSTGSATLALYDVPADISGSVAIGASTSVTIASVGQNARVAFTGAAGQRVSLKVAWSYTACCLVKVSILKPDGTTLSAPLSVGATGAFIDPSTLPVAGTYTILVDPQVGATGTTTLTLYDVPPDVTGSISVGGAPQTVTTTAPGQNARLTFAGTAGDGVVLRVSGATMTVRVSILKPDGTALTSPSGGPVYTRLPVSGTYTILVDPQGAATGRVTLTLELDNTAPSPPALTLTEASGNSHVVGSAFYYRPNGAGSTFSVIATSSDGSSGLQKIRFPGLAGGMTPTSAVDDASTPYTRTYTWSTGATYDNPSNTVTAYDRIGNTSASAFAVVRDPNAPATGDNTASIGSAWKNTDQQVTLTPSDAGGAGVAATYYTTNGSTPTTSSTVGTALTLSTDGVYTIKYFSVDNVGNTEAVRTGASQIRIDKTSPSSTVTFPNAGAVYSSAGWGAGCTSAGICGTTSDALSGVQRVEVSVRQGTGNYWDGSAFASASELFAPVTGTGSWTYGFPAVNFPADGTYTVRVRVLDNAGNMQASTRSFTYDTSAPETTITAAPADPTNAPSATFSFSSEAGATFECSLDGAAFSACTSPKAYSGLADGSHSFQVRARDAAGNIDPTPAARSWTVDTTAPDTNIDSGPAGATSATPASFTFSSSEAGSTFECSLDGAAFAACSSPDSHSGLGEGAHTFEVRAIDAAGNTDDTPAFRAWTVDTSAPETTIDSAPESVTTETSATFAFSSEPGATFECSLDGEVFSACASPRTYEGLAAGVHTLEVRAVDAADNADATPAGHTWTVATAP